MWLEPKIGNCKIRRKSQELDGTWTDLPAAITNLGKSCGQSGPSHLPANNPEMSVHLVEELESLHNVVVLYLGQRQVVVISNHILQGAPSQCGQGRRCASHLDESRIARRWNVRRPSREKLTLYQVAAR